MDTRPRRFRPLARGQEFDWERYAPPANPLKIGFSANRGFALENSGIHVPQSGAVEKRTPTPAAKPPSRFERRLGFSLLIAYAAILFLLLSNQRLPFPLGSEDQLRVAEAIDGTGKFRSDSWAANALDGFFGRMLPARWVYPAMELSRRLGAVLALTGLVVWLGRNQGWVKSFWIAAIGLGLLSWRLSGITLEPHSLAVAMVVWGYALTFGRPWSKTGSAEQTAGGALLGGASLAAPLSFFFVLVIPIRSILSRKYRRRLETPFWWGFIAGCLPGIYWLLSAPSGSRRESGFHPETIGWVKIEQFFFLVSDTFGWLFFSLALLGLVLLLKEGTGWERPAFDLTWPFIPAAILGYLDPIAGALVVPGLILCATVFLEKVGKVFVAKTEQAALPTLLAVGIGYYLFFSGLDVVRERQAHAREVDELSEMVSDHVPPDEPVCLFRLNSIVELLNATTEIKKWRSVPKGEFEGLLWVKGSHGQNPKTAEVEPRGAVWIDPKRMAEPISGSGAAAVKEIRSHPGVRKISGHHGAELWRVPLAESQ